jgi:hypothetical protein
MIKLKPNLSLLIQQETGILDVPIELVNEFISNPLNSLRDYACIPTRAISPFFTDYEKLDMCIIKAEDNPFDSSLRSFIESYQCEDDFFRYLHIDLGWTKDGLGIAMCHIPKWKEIERVIEDKENQKYEIVKILQPYIKFDFVGRIKSENRQEILISIAQDLILELANKRNFYINLVTFDRCESVQMIQTLREMGFNASHLSVDRTAYKIMVNYDKDNAIERVSTDKQYNAAFECFRYAVQEERVELPFHEDFYQETRGLEYIPKEDKVIK